MGLPHRLNRASTGPAATGRPWAGEIRQYLADVQLRKGSRGAPTLPTIDRDGWELRSAEASHRANPQTFWIPPAAVRENLRRGQAAKLIFDFLGVEEDGSPSVQGERMYVIVREQVGERYIGLLIDTPQLIELSDDFYLRPAAEVPFGPEHVIDVEQPPEQVIELMFSDPPTRTWK